MERRQAAARAFHLERKHALQADQQEARLIALSPRWAHSLQRELNRQHAVYEEVTA